MPSARRCATGRRRRTTPSRTRSGCSPKWPEGPGLDMATAAAPTALWTPAVPSDPTSSKMTRYFIPHSRLRRPSRPIAPPGSGRSRHHQRRCPSAQSGMVRHREIKAEKADDRADQTFGLAQRGAKHRAERQRPRLVRASACQAAIAALGALRHGWCWPKAACLLSGAQLGKADAGVGHRFGSIRPMHEPASRDWCCGWVMPGA
jgi:hypothetical protein